MYFHGKIKVADFFYVLCGHVRFLFSRPLALLVRDAESAEKNLSARNFHASLCLPREWWWPWIFYDFTCINKD